MSVKFTINGRAIDVDVPSDTPLLWVVRDELDLKGTKFGCGIGLCGACTVHVEGSAQRSCITPVSQVAGKQITTIEGLGGDGPHPLQKAWVEAQAPQCGYCQSGQIMQAATLLAQNPEPTDAEITAGMNGNLCRCMTYGRIKSAIKIAAKEMKGGRENV
ncbi:MAG: isoquinoline 1-oxidoreductase alpha subunit [Candidatus Azotimanducaceae bacterium]|jgi:isoquinoline 1-oxidoreductase alpha subunit